MKQSVKSVLSALIAAGMLTAPAMAAFADVPSNAWYAKDVESVQSLGIIQGKENNQFDPDGTLTIAEAVTLAAKTHARDAGESIPAVAGAWYQGAVEYAQQSSIMTGTEFTDYNATATRAQMAYLFARALPTANYTSINNIAALPDVTSNTPYNEEIFRLYNAGILSGSDDYGTFHPTDTITRAEAAAIINRLVSSTNRRTIELKKAPENSEATTINQSDPYRRSVKEGDTFITTDGQKITVTKNPVTGTYNPEAAVGFDLGRDNIDGPIELGSVSDGSDGGVLGDVMLKGPNGHIAWTSTWRAIANSGWDKPTTPGTSDGQRSPNKLYVWSATYQMWSFDNELDAKL